MRTLNLLLLTLVALAWVTSNQARGATVEVQPLADIRARVEAYLGTQLPAGVETRTSVGRLDPRLRLARCGEPLEAFAPAHQGTSGNVTVGVRCSVPKRWTIYVPARVEVFKQVAIARRSVSRGMTLAAADLRFEKREVSRLRSGYFTRAEDVVGLQARRTLTEGTAISVNMLTQPTWVRRGERVTLVAANDVIQVRADGTALTDAARGERVSVRNERSRRVVEGVVVLPGVVRVRM